MNLLRRILGGGETPEVPDTAPVDPAEADAAERAHELELARGEQERLDELAQRQLKYEQYSWQPPPQGGERRADDADPPGNG